jgi:hypothetical protein
MRQAIMHHDFVLGDFVNLDEVKITTLTATT